MWPLKKEKGIIINTGDNLPEATTAQEMRFLSEKNRFLKLNIEAQVKKNKDVIYGAQAVNAIVGPGFSRPTSDYDIFSHDPKRRAIELEKTIDNHVGADIAHVRQVSYERNGQLGKMFRVELKNWSGIADFNPMPSGLKTVTVNGVKYENLGRAEQKYNKMLNDNETKRVINAHADLGRIALFKYWRKVF